MCDGQWLVGAGADWRFVFKLGFYGRIGLQQERPRGGFVQSSLLV